MTTHKYWLYVFHSQISNFVIRLAQQYFGVQSMFYLKLIQYIKGGFFFTSEVQLSPQKTEAILWL